MDWFTLLKNLGFFTVGASTLTGLIIYFSKKIFENQISILKTEHLYRFTTLYTEKIEVIKETFKRIVHAEKALRILTIPTSSDEKKKENYKNALTNLDSFFGFYEENELFLDDNSLKLIKELKLKFEDVLNAHNKAEFMEIMRGTEQWANAIENKMKVYEAVLDNEIPAIKEQLKQDFQEKYKLIEIEK
jgi:vacuolar-type H+-ATPase subunit F/Vma7